MVTDKKLKDKKSIKSYFNTPYKRFIILIFAIAILLRFLYVIKIDAYKNQHDVGTVNANGGMAYCKYIYDNHKLPDNNHGQFYHPPLHHIVSAIWIKVFSVFSNDFNTLFNTTKYLTLIYSIFTLFIFYKILKELHIKDKFKIYMFMTFSLMPVGIILAGSLNNDGLCYTLSLWAILRLIKWYKKSTFKNIIYLAIITGLTVMTKMSGALLAIPIAYVFLIQFIRSIKKNIKIKDNKKSRNNWIKYISQYCIFGLISLPIGLWYSIRNLIKFKQSIMYVLDIHNPELYTGDFTIIQRFLPGLSEFDQMFAHPFDDHNIPVYVIKTFLFGEWKEWKNIPGLYYIAIIFTFILAIVAIIALVRSLIIVNKRNIIWRDAFGLFTFVNIIMFFKMNVELPYGCSMDFRYMVLTLFTGIMAIYFALYDLKRKDIKKAEFILDVIFIMTIIVIVGVNLIILLTPSASLTTY